MAEVQMFHWYIAFCSFAVLNVMTGAAWQSEICLQQHWMQGRAEFSAFASHWYCRGVLPQCHHGGRAWPPKVDRQPEEVATKSCHACARNTAILPCIRAVHRSTGDVLFGVSKKWFVEKTRCVPKEKTQHLVLNFYVLCFCARGKQGICCLRTSDCDWCVAVILLQRLLGLFTEPVDWLLPQFCLCPVCREISNSVLSHVSWSQFFSMLRHFPLPQVPKCRQISSFVGAGNTAAGSSLGQCCGVFGVEVSAFASPVCVCVCACVSVCFFSFCVCGVL